MSVATINFGTLINQEASETLLTRIEYLTGNRYAYGLDTPINLRTLADSQGLETALECMGYSDDATTAIVTNFCADCITDYLYVWNSVYPSDSRLLNIIVYTLQYLNTIVAPEAQRFNYCGEPLAKASDFLESNLEQYADDFETYLNTLTDLGTFQKFYRAVLTPDLPTIVNPNVVYVNGPILDWMNSTYLPSFQQEQFSIEDIFNRVKGTPFLEQSEDLTRRTIEQGFDIDRFAVYTGVYYKTWDGATPLKDQVKQGAITLGYAGVNLARLVLTNSNDPTAITSGVQSAYSSWTQGKVKDLDNRLGRLATMYYALSPPMTAFLGDPDDIDTQVYNAAIQKRIQLLNDLNYIRTFDQDQNGFLSTAERGTMERDIRRQMLTARKEFALSLQVTTQNEINQYLNSNADLKTVFNLYFE